MVGLCPLLAVDEFSLARWTDIILYDAVTQWTDDQLSDALPSVS
jgi:hypothetical protein